MDERIYDSRLDATLDARIYYPTLEALTLKDVYDALQARWQQVGPACIEREVHLPARSFGIVRQAVDPHGDPEATRFTAETDLGVYDFVLDHTIPAGGVGLVATSEGVDPRIVPPSLGVERLPDGSERLIPISEE